MTITTVPSFDSDTMSATAHILLRLEAGETIERDSLGEVYGCSPSLLGVIVSDRRKRGWEFDTKAPGSVTLVKKPEHETPPTPRAAAPAETRERVLAVFTTNPGVEMRMEKIADIAGLSHGQVAGVMVRNAEAWKADGLHKIRRGVYVWNGEPSGRAKGNTNGTGDAVVAWCREHPEYEFSAPEVVAGTGLDGKSVSNALNALVSGKMAAEKLGLIRGDSRGTFRWVGLERAARFLPRKAKAKGKKKAKTKPNGATDHLPVLALPAGVVRTRTPAPVSNGEAVLPTVGDALFLNQITLDETTGDIYVRARHGKRQLVFGLASIIDS